MRRGKEKDLRRIMSRRGFVLAGATVTMTDFWGAPIICRSHKPAVIRAFLTVISLMCGSLHLRAAGFLTIKCVFGGW